jgi:hypothetical protein
MDDVNILPMLRTATIVFIRTERSKIGKYKLKYNKLEESDGTGYTRTERIIQGESILTNTIKKH